MKSKNIKKCFIYTRSATLEDSSANSVLRQERLCLEFAKKHGFKVERIFQDLGASGNFIQRTGLQDLLSNLDKSSVQTVIVLRSDRISRKLIDFITINDMLKQKGINLISVFEGDLGKSTSQLISIVSIGLAQYEAEMIARRMRK